MAFWSRRRPTDGPAAQPEIAASDWSSVTTPEQVRDLVRQGVLEPMLLLPAAYGGKEQPMNVVHVPRGLVALREQTVLGTVNQMIGDGVADSYTTDVEYRGDSQIPAALHIHATGSGSTGGFHPTLTIW